MTKQIIFLCKKMASSIFELRHLFFCKKKAIWNCSNWLFYFCKSWNYFM